MIVSVLAAALLLAAPPQSEPSPKPSSRIISPEQLEKARQKHEAARQAAVHINELAGNIHSEQDARAFVDAVAGELYGHDRLPWMTRSIRQRVAHAEYEAVSDPARLIPEQRVVDVWNEYVRELDAPEETLITLAELHNLRDSIYASRQRLWSRELFQSIWTMPNVYAESADGKMPDGCRALEALRLLHDLVYTFPSLRMARERVQKGVLVSDLLKQRDQSATPPAQPARAELKMMTAMSVAPVQPAESRYVQAHGERDYERLIRRLFDELFPRD